MLTPIHRSWLCQFCQRGRETLGVGGRRRFGSGSWQRGSKFKKRYCMQRDQILKIELVNRNNPTCNEHEQHLYDPFFMRQAPSRPIEAKNISISGSIKCLRKQLFIYDPKRTMGECQLSWSPLCRLVLNQILVWYGDLQ